VITEVNRTFQIEGYDGPIGDGQSAMGKHRLKERSGMSLCRLFGMAGERHREIRAAYSKLKAWTGIKAKIKAEKKLKDQQYGHEDGGRELSMRICMPRRGGLGGRHASEERLNFQEINKIIGGELAETRDSRRPKDIRSRRDQKANSGGVQGKED